MFSRILNSLTYIIKKEAREWEKYNSVRKEYKYNAAEKMFSKWAMNPLKYTLFLLFLYFLALLNIFLWNDNLAFYFKQTWNASNVLNYFTALWSVQGIVVGLVYPIVIGFVSFLLHNKSAYKVWLRSFLTDSCAVFMGLSSLFLVALMGLQYCFFPYGKYLIIVKLVILDTFWFVFNVFGTMWFLYRTVNFLKPDLRNLNIKKYLINTIYPQEMTELLKHHFYLGAQNYGLIPGSWEDNGKMKNKGPSVIMHTLGSDFGSTALKKKFNRKFVLHNVLFKPLSLACKSWLKRANKGTDKPESRNIDYYGKDDYMIMFPLLPGETYEGEREICRIRGAEVLSLFEKIIIKISFRFKKFKNYEKAIQTLDVLVGFQADVLDAINSGQQKHFENAADDIQEIHVLIIKAGKFLNDQGNIDNWANLSRDISPNYIEWNKIYLDLFDRSVKLLSHSTSYFSNISYIPNRLYAHTVDDVTENISNSFLMLSNSLWIKLRDWWTRTIESQGINEHGFKAPNLLTYPSFNWYQEAVYSFVSSWESLVKYYLPNPGRGDNIKWNYFYKFANQYATHLNYTAKMLINSAIVGDIYGSEWILDVFQKWKSSLSYKLNFDEYRIQRSHHLTIESLLISSDKAQKLLEEGSLSGNTDLPWSTLFAICIKNYWIDVNCIVLCIFCQWAKESNDNQSIPVQFIQTILSGTPKKAGGSIYESNKPFKNATELFRSIIRQYFSDGGYRHGYREKLDALVESIKDIEKPKMISGRIYSGLGGPNLENTKHSQLFLLCLIVNSNWNPQRDLESDIREIVLNDDDNARELRDLLKTYENILNESFFEFHKHAYSLIRNPENSNTEFKEKVANIKKGLNQLIEVLDSQRQSQIIKLPINEQRLQTIAHYVSEKAFSKEKAKIPTTFFAAVTITASSAESLNLTIRKMNRGEFTNPLMAQLPINEKESFADIMNRHIAAVVMNLVVGQAIVETFNATDERTYLDVLNDQASKFTAKGYSPVLLLDNPTRPEWVWNWENSYYHRNGPLPDGLKVYKEDNQIAGYICQFNDVVVYNAPIPYGFSYLVAKEIFREIIILDYGSDRFVDARILQNYEDQALVDLELNYSIKVLIEKIPIIRLKYFE